MEGGPVPAAEVFQIRDLDGRTLRDESERILRLIQDVVPYASIMEVGSTAVEGVTGKQDIDFAVRVPLGRFAETRSALDRHFERNDRQLSNSEYQGYLVRSPLDVAIQLIVAKGQHDNFERFLRLLSSDRELRTAYNHLKSAWHGRPMESYRVAKQAFIDSALSNENRKSTNQQSTREESSPVLWRSCHKKFDHHTPISAAWQKFERSRRFAQSERKS